MKARKPNMPELPEIRHLAGQIDRALKGTVIVSTEVRQEKCINRPVYEWNGMITGRKMIAAKSRGKWCDMKLEGGVHLRLNLGMGGEFLLHELEEELPAKWRIVLRLEDGRRLSVNFWWFGSLHAVNEGEEHTVYDSLGIDALDSGLDENMFREMYIRRKAAIKTLLLDQKLICGVGNYYSHDILFLAGIHPMKRACDMTRDEYGKLYRAMRETFEKAVQMGGADYERDLYNCTGKWNRSLVGYRSGANCPVCGEMIAEIRTGATTGYICPNCQRM